VKNESIRNNTSLQVEKYKLLTARNFTHNVVRDDKLPVEEGS